MRDHTPAPWHTTEAPREEGFSIIGPTRRRIALVPGVQSCNVPSPENRANARLITAAPELLDALDGLLGIYDAEGQPAEPGTAVAMAREAIAKARRTT